MDILCHALESYTARPYTTYERKSRRSACRTAARIRSRTCGRSRRWRLLAGSFRTAVRDGDDQAGPGEMAMAATFAGLGFGNAGVHIPHANAYPIAGRVRDFRPPDYPGTEPLVPHGMSVALTAPEAFRFTFAAAPGAAPAGRRSCSRRAPTPGRRPGGGAARRADRADARHRAAGRRGRGRLHRRRHPRPGRRRAQAAAAAGHLPARR